MPGAPTSQHSIKRIHCAVLGLSFILSLCQPSIAFAAVPKPPPTSAVSDAELSAVERQMLQKTFSQDPIDKRLQRLELLVFGATQFGSDLERWRLLQHSLAERKKEQGQKPRRSETANVGEDVTMLEKEILKKTFAGEPTTKRLDRLESKIFGQPTATMAPQTRIERLKRATGSVEPEDGQQTAIIPYGSGRGLRQRVPFSDPFNGQMMPGFPGFSQADPQMREMLRQMEQQMRELDQYGNGRQPIPNMPGNGQFDLHFYYQGPDGKPHYFHSSPNKTPDGSASPKEQRRPAIPGLKVPNINEIPPYGDPNSI